MSLPGYLAPGMYISSPKRKTTMQLTLIEGSATKLFSRKKQERAYRSGVRVRAYYVTPDM